MRKTVKKAKLSPRFPVKFVKKTRYGEFFLKNPLDKQLNMYYNVRVIK